MSVTKTNDPINDLLAAADTARKARDANKSSDARDGATPAEEPTTAQFSRLLKERLTGNIVFTRLDQQLDLPQRVVSERASAPVVDRRDELDSRDDVDPFDATDSLEHPAAAPVDTAADRGRIDPVRADATPRGETASARNDAGSNRQGAANEANQAVQRTQSGDGLVTEDAAPELAALVTRQAKSDSAKITATVTQEQARVASQPQAALAARAAVDATATNRSGATPDADPDRRRRPDGGGRRHRNVDLRSRPRRGRGGRQGPNGGQREHADGGDAGKVRRRPLKTRNNRPSNSARRYTAPRRGPGERAAAGAVSGRHHRRRRRHRRHRLPGREQLDPATQRAGAHPGGPSPATPSPPACWRIRWR
jgi:hypothetical protein